MNDKNIAINKNDITFVFFRHGQTPWNKENRAQGSSNDPVANGLTQEGKKVVKETACRLAQELEHVNRENIYIYTAPLHRTYDTSRIIAKELNLLKEHLVINNMLSGRKYGKIEGKADVKKLKTIVKNPGLAISYLLSEFGVRNNGQNIETKSDFKDRVFWALDDIFSNHKKGDVVIISANSDIWDRIRKSESAKLLFDFEHQQAIEPGCMVKYQMPGEVSDLIQDVKSFSSADGRIL